MLLALDVGNTNITLGVFDGEELLFVSRMATDASRMEDQYAIELRDISTCTGCAGPTSPGQSSARWCPSSPATWQTGGKALFRQALDCQLRNGEGLFAHCHPPAGNHRSRLDRRLRGGQGLLLLPLHRHRYGHRHHLGGHGQGGRHGGRGHRPRDGCLFGRPHPAGGAALLGEPGTSRPRGGPGHRGVPPVRGAVRRRRHAGRAFATAWRKSWATPAG